MSETNLPKVLIVDDSELIHRLLQMRLQNERIQLLSARSSTEGLLMAHELKPEVILLDIDLPKMDGFEFIIKLKSDPQTQEIAVIFVSSANETANRVRGLDLGAVDFIAKPFDIVELKARLRTALRTQHYIQMLEQKAQIDALSGLWNRSYFDKRIEIEVAGSDRHAHPLSLVYCDIDHFKLINDRYGHLFGDTVIEEFSKILNCGRLTDIPCRWGGEEFAVILPQTSIQEASRVAEKYRKQLNDLVWPEHPGLVITSSFGVCDIQCCESPPNSKNLFNSAEIALYKAKENGRNLVELFTKKIPLSTK